MKVYAKIVMMVSLVIIVLMNVSLYNQIETNEHQVGERLDDSVDRIDYASSWSRLWSSSINVESSSNCHFMEQQEVPINRVLFKECPTDRLYSYWDEDMLTLHVLIQEEVRVTFIDENPYNDVTHPKVMAQKDRQWINVSGPTAVKVDHSVEFIGVYRDDHTYQVHTRVSNIKQSVNTDTNDIVNIMFFSIDSISRANFMRSLPLLADTLKGFNSGDKYRSFVFNRYNGLYPGSSAANFSPLLSGQRYDVLALRPDRWKTQTYKNPEITEEDWIWNWLEKKGYITAASMGECGGAFGSSYWPNEGFSHVSPVYSNDCHYHYLPGVDTGDGFCINDKHPHELNVEYLLDFWKKYEVVNKFGWMNLIEGHTENHFAVNIIQNASIKLVSEVLKDDKTILFVLSDHGREGGIEQRLPLMSIVLPIPFLLKNKGIEKTLFNNQEMLISPYDIYKTMKHLIDNPNEANYNVDNPSIYSTTSQSLLSEISPNRTCDQANLPLTACVCVVWKSKDISTVPSQLISIIETNVNKKISDYPPCMTLTVGDILSYEEAYEEQFIHYKKVIFMFSQSDAQQYTAIFEVGTETKMTSIELMQTRRIYQSCTPKNGPSNYCICELDTIKR